MRDTMVSDSENCRSKKECQSHYTGPGEDQTLRENQTDSTQSVQHQRLTVKKSSCTNTEVPIKVALNLSHVLSSVGC